MIGGVEIKRIRAPACLAWMPEYVLRIGRYIALGLAVNHRTHDLWGLDVMSPEVAPLRAELVVSSTTTPYRSCSASVSSVRSVENTITTRSLAGVEDSASYTDG